MLDGLASPLGAAGSHLYKRTMHATASASRANATHEQPCLEEAFSEFVMPWKFEQKQVPEPAPCPVNY